jgi:hypothetical protein
MRITYALAVVGLFAGAPAMAQVVIATPGNSASAHDYQADQNRAAGHQNMDAARANAAVGNYDAAAQDQAAARADMHAAHHEEHAAERDSSGAPVILQVR